MKYILLCGTLLFLLGRTTAQDKDEVSFSKNLYPILKSKCLKCHEKDDENPNNYAMDNVSLMRTSGKTKNIVIPGDGAKSYLILKLLPNPPKGAQMPIFSKKKLSEEDVDLFKRWIDQGAKDN
ncbi:MAG: c-type cytochrome domain-containing protein [Bacteroidota bacterium]|nr:c-type cytochrome domain-containing protein [Bacteroidota bacterium]